MNLLIKNAWVVDPNFSFNSQSADIFIGNGIIKRTGKNLSNKADKEISVDRLRVSRSKNSPFMGKKLTGKVTGIINKDQVHLNP